MYQALLDRPLVRGGQGPSRFPRIPWRSVQSRRRGSGGRPVRSAPASCFCANRMYLSQVWRILGCMTSGERWRLGRRPALDGLRGVAVLLVVAYHVAGEKFPAGGIVGVTAFFVLSGFLITSLLLEEHRSTGRVSLTAFYGRRARRLFPALALMLSIAVPIALLTGTVPPASAVAVVFYSANWWLLTGHHLGMLIHTWTLSSEEQFYLLWPVALLALRRTRRPLLLIGALALVPLAFLSQLSIAVSADALLLGCGLGVWMHDRPTPRPLPTAVIPLALSAMFAACWIHAAPIWATLASSAASLVVVYGIATGSAATLLNGAPMRAIGRRSYGLYLWHLPILTVSLWIGTAAGLGYWQSVAVALPVVFGIVELSWRFVEQPFLRNARGASKVLERRDALGRGSVGRRGEPDVRWRDGAGDRGRPDQPRDTIGREVAAPHVRP